MRVVAPSFSLGIISEEVQEIANQRFEEIGLKLEFGERVNEINCHLSSSIESRIADLHAAYEDKQIKAIFAVIGGYNCNQLLSHIDWDLIKRNPKPLIGYSDTTALQNAIYAKTGQRCFSGPAYSTFGQKYYFDYTLEYFKKILMSNELVKIKPSKNWTDDQWFIDQENRHLHANEGWMVVNEGSAQGRIVGGNLGTFNALFGTEYMPDLNNTILFLEGDECEKFNEFDRLFQSLLHQPGFNGVRGIVLGRFQVASEMTEDKIREFFSIRPELSDLPIVANVDFGHTSPIITYPIGGTANLEVKNDITNLEIIE